MSDLIDRQAAIDELTRFITPHDNGDGTWTVGVLSKSSITDILNDLPSAQLEKVDTPTVDTPTCEDVVSRQAVYNVLDKMPVRGFKKDGETIHGLISLSQVNSAIIDLPSAQPEPLTDKEQRIFLSAMGREEEVCKEVDDAWRDCREPYEDSLVHVCNEIKRKVKGALWT